MAVDRDKRIGFDKGKTARYALSAGLGLLALGVLAFDQAGPDLRDPAALDRALRQAILDCEAHDVRYLIAQSADPNRVAPESDGTDLLYPARGGPPLQAYVRCDTPETLEALRAGGADLAPHLRRLASLSMAPARPEVLAWLLQQGFDPNQRWANAEGWETLTHRAARRAQPDLLALLLEAGADPSARDSEGITPLGRLSLVIAQHNRALRHAVDGRPRIRDVFDPQAYFATVIAMLQEAGGTE